MVEVAGIEPASESKATGASTSVALICVLQQGLHEAGTPYCQLFLDSPAWRKSSSPGRVACCYDTLLIPTGLEKEGAPRFYAASAT